jgi:hypothetical protein
MTSPTWRAATRWAVEVVFVDLDEVIPGSIDEATGALTSARPATRPVTAWSTR